MTGFKRKSKSKWQLLWPHVASGFDSIPYKADSIPELLEQEANDHVERLRADALTRARYAGVESLRVWEAVSLQCDISPGGLNLWRGDERRYLERLAAAATGESRALVLLLIRKLQLARAAVSERWLKVISIDPDDSLQSFCNRRDFERFMGCERTDHDDLEPLGRVAPPLEIRRRTPKLDIHIRAGELWNSGLRCTNADVEEFLIGHGISPSAARIGARLIHPPEIGAGAISKWTRRWHENEGAE